MMTTEPWDIDTFAGAGGWEVGASLLGLDPLGIELDDAACATREAVGLRTLQADVAALDPTDFAPIRVLIGSPPCPTFSGAGDGRGRHLIDLIAAAMSDLAAGRDTRQLRSDEAAELLYPAVLAKLKDQDSKPVEKARQLARRDADLSLLVVEPLRWALAARPQFVVLEQVPPVLGVWQLLAEHLREAGYGVWTGILEAERYGVPQTRERA